MAETLLPPSAQPYLKALSEAFAAVADLPIGVLDDLWSPARAPEAVLPLLAQALGVTLWRGDWTLAKKRQVLARAPALSRHRGTRTAFERLLALVDAELVGFRAAPQTLLARRPRTAAERAAWAAQFPELQIRKLRSRHERFGGLVVGEPWCGGRRAPRDSSAGTFNGRHAFLVRDGVETPLRLQTVSDGLRIGLTSARPRFVLGRPLSKSAGAPAASLASDRTYNFIPGATRTDVLPPSATAIDIAPKPVGQASPRLGGMCVGKAIAGVRRAPRPSTASERVYQSLRLLDPAQARLGKIKPRGGWYAGRSRLGQPPFELHLDVDLARKVPGRRPWPLSPSGPLRAHDARPLEDAMAAARSAKLGRDQVLLRTGLYRPIRAGDGVSLDGGYRLGQIVRSL